MEQPTSRYFGAALKKAVESGEVPVARLNDMVRRIVRAEFVSGVFDNPQPTKVPDVFYGFKVAQRTAEESMVLLKNDKSQLPLHAAALKSIAVIGGHADVGVISGGGSAQVDAAGGNAVPDPKMANDILAAFNQVIFHRSSPLNSLRELAPSIKISYDAGSDLEAAAAAAKSADVAIVFVTQHTHEGNDLETLALPNGQDALVEKVAAANPHTIVVIESGDPVLTPWASKVSAIVEAWYPGIRGGEALANLLFGKVNFSGKLAISFPASDADLPHATVFAPPGKKPTPLDGLLGPKPVFTAVYDEGLKVGYKWFDAEKNTPAYPFGFGLSYTTFAYSNLKATGGTSAEVSFTVRNTGKLAGKEVAQVYLSLPASAQEPPKRLIGWEKVELQPGESKTVTLKIDPLYLSIFDVATDHWTIVPGEYKVMVGPSSAELPLTAAVTLKGAGM
jgi:beta-glucosidase